MLRHVDIMYSDDAMKVARWLLWHWSFGIDEEDDIDTEDVNSFMDGFHFDPYALDYVDEIARYLEQVQEANLTKRYTVASRRASQGTSTEVLATIMFPLGYFYLLEITPGELPRGPLPEPEVDNRPAVGSGADFVYMALKAIGLQFSYEEFREHFMVMQRDLARELEDDDEFKDDAW